MTPEGDVVLTPRLGGKSLAVAGLAAWILGHAGRGEEAAATTELQDLVDAALSRGDAEIRLPAAVATRAADLWDGAAGVADTWAATATPERTAAQWAQHAQRLRTRAGGLRRLLGQVRG